MGVFSRFKDIVGSNINSLLDKAEDPRKLIRLMLREMEETLVELKASCAKTMAEAKNLEREREHVRAQADKWAARAELAVDKGRDDLAREALVEKNNFARRLDALDQEGVHLEGLVAQAREDIARLEDKVRSAREKQRLLEQRHARATQRRRAGQTLTRAESSDVLLRFDHFENRIEHLEAEAELAAPGRRPDLEDEFSLLEKEDSISDELSAMKKARTGAKAEPKAEKKS